jgi:hypothetical protein
VTMAKYGRRYWAVWDGEDLVAVTVYKKGAKEVRRRLMRGIRRRPQTEATAL